ncbi:MAG TPA: rhomboid family intramembrane serine protease [Candidatus Limnocylindrales bacterium]
MPDQPLDPTVTGPLTADQARLLLDQAAELYSGGDFADAAATYQRVVGHPDAATTAAAMLGLGQSLYRLDRDDEALAVWEQVLKLPETPSTYRAWREVAAARVRSGDLRAALTAYREADRRAPAADRPEIASRLGWLLKETGETRAAGRQFARARGNAGLPLTWVIIGITVVVSFAAWSGSRDFDVYGAFELDKHAVAAGEYWRLFTVTLVHAPPDFGYLHLFFNMYALYLAGPIVERLYGRLVFGGFYVLCAVGASIASFVFGSDVPSVGASGAIFGLFGVILAASRIHHPMLDRQGRALVGQLGTLIVLNLVIGFAMSSSVDNFAHVGGLLSGLWLGYLIPPGAAPTLSSLWIRPSSAGGTSGAAVGGGQSLLRVLGLVALVLLFVVGIVVGTAART